MSPKLSLVIPTFNEGENLPVLVRRIHRVLSPRLEYELIVVDDNSPDGTGELAERLSKEYPIKVIHRSERRGLASAVVDGFDVADGKILGVIDADLQHPPRKIPLLLEEAENGADLVIGSRHTRGGRIGRWPLSRKIMSRGARFLAGILVPKAKIIKDPLSGFFLLKREVIEDADLNPEGYKILLEILGKGKYEKVVEVPYTFADRKRGRSKLGFRENIAYFRHLLQLARSSKIEEMSKGAGSK